MEKENNSFTLNITDKLSGLRTIQVDIDDIKEENSMLKEFKKTNILMIGHIGMGMAVHAHAMAHTVMRLKEMNAYQMHVPAGVTDELKSFIESQQPPLAERMLDLEKITLQLTKMEKPFKEKPPKHWLTKRNKKL